MTHTKSQALFKEALHFMPGGVNSPVRAFRAVGGEPFFAQRAQGARIWDVDGNCYIDYVCTWGPSILGHATRAVIDAIQQAAEFGTSFGVPNPLEVELARKICSWVPSVQKVRMMSSGTEACMTAIRLARGFTGRDKIIKFDGCYHGHSDSLLVKAGSGALTFGEPDSAGVPRVLAALTLTLPFNDLIAVKACLKANKKEIAAIILEPIPANAGLILPKAGYLEGLRKLCNAYGVVLIFDEVMTGFRLGRDGAQGLMGVRPDLSTFGKVIGGGLPVGAVGGRAEIMDHLAPLGKVYQAGTLSGNPLAMAAGLAQLNRLESELGFARLELMGSHLEKGIKKVLKKLDLPLQFYRVGSMFCLFFTGQKVTDLTSAMTSDRAKFGKFFHALLKAGVYLPPSQFETCFLSLAHEDRDIEETLRIMAGALKKI